MGADVPPHIMQRIRIVYIAGIRVGNGCGTERPRFTPGVNAEILSLYEDNSY